MMAGRPARGDFFMCLCISIFPRVFRLGGAPPATLGELQLDRLATMEIPQARGRARESERLSGRHADGRPELRELEDRLCRDVCAQSGPARFDPGSGPVEIAEVDAAGCLE